MTDRDPPIPFRQSDRDALRKAVGDITWLKWVIVLGFSVLALLTRLDGTQWWVFNL